MPRLGLVLAALVAASMTGRIIASDDLPPYKPVDKLSGRLTCIGSKSGTEVIVTWASAFKALYPDVSVHVDQTKGSSAAFPALVTGAANLAPMSRPMSRGMIDEYTQRRGYPPTDIRIGLGGVVVIVHPQNPVKGLKRSDLDGIFSASYMIAGRAILEWGQAGVEGDWAEQPITLYSLEEDTGAWGLFRAEAMSMAGTMKPSAKQLDSVEAVRQAVAADRTAIGFLPIGTDTTNVRVVPIADDGVVGALTLGYERPAPRTSAFVSPDRESLADESYPLTRYFRMYVDRPPNQPLDPALREFLLYAISAEGQREMRKAGYLPLPPSVAELERNKLEAIR